MASEAMTPRHPGERAITLTFEQWERAKATADARMKATNGHYFVTILKTRCQYCGRSPRARGRCGQWFQTFLAHLDIVLLNLVRPDPPVKETQ